MEEQSWTVSSVALALGGILGIGTLVASLFSEAVRSTIGDPRVIVRRVRALFVSSGTADRFRILVADLVRDGDGSQTDHVARAFDDIDGFEVVKIGPGPQWDLGTRDQRETKARDLLARRHGEVLIFGEVAKADEVLRLHIIGATAQGARGTYALQQTELPADFSSDFNAVLVAVAGAAAAPAIESTGRYLVHLLIPVADKLARLCAHMPTGLDADQRGALAHSLGSVSLVLGEQTGERHRFESAVSAFQTALEDLARDRVPLGWAMTQNNLGNALARLGQRESDTASLEQAVAACSAALKEFTRELVPLEWAMTQNNLGHTLSMLGERESDSARLGLAVAALRAALQEWTRDRVPLGWAMAQDNLGTALFRLGVRESDTARLDDAVAAYRAALEERRRDRVPLEWATTQNNLGTALSVLGERDSNTGRLREAVAAYRAALKEWSRDRVPLDWAMTQNNLGNALSILGVRESNTAVLKQAVAAHRATLQVWTRERVPLDWARTQNNLGTALQRLGERASGTARLEEAVAAYRAALEERTRDRVPLDWAATTANLAVALAAIAERTGQPRDAALAEIDAALEVFRAAGAEAYVAKAEGIRAAIAGADPG